MGGSTAALKAALQLAAPAGEETSTQAASVGEEAAALSVPAGDEEATQATLAGRQTRRQQHW